LIEQEPLYHRLQADNAAATWAATTAMFGIPSAIGLLMLFESDAPILINDVQLQEAT
jgi:hypothetical protein